MSTQPEALRLAQMLETLGWRSVDKDLKKAAAELRRLYAEVDKLSYRLAYPDNFVNEERDELLAALKEVLNCDKTKTSFGAVMRARAAIIKAEGKS